MLKSLPLECAEPSVNDGLDSEATEWLSCEKQKKLDKTSNAIQGKKRKHKQVLPKQLDNLASVDAGRGRRSINSGFLSTASSVSSRSLTQSKLTAFFKQAPKTLPSHRSDKCIK